MSVALNMFLNNTNNFMYQIIRFPMGLRPLSCTFDRNAEYGKLGIFWPPPLNYSSEVTSDESSQS